MKPCWPGCLLSGAKVSECLFGLSTARASTARSKASNGRNCSAARLPWPSSPPFAVMPAELRPLPPAAYHMASIDQEGLVERCRFCHVILFSYSGRKGEDEGIYTCSYFPDGDEAVSVNMVVAFEAKEDAERAAGLLEASLAFSCCCRWHPDDGTTPEKDPLSLCLS